MKIAVIQFPGSNCERETSLALKRVGLEPIPFLWNEPVTKLEACAGYVIIGGFSYEDRSRAGAIAALDPVMTVIKQQAEQGKPVLGICNGAQILVESGLVPGYQDYPLAVALTDNKRIKEGQVVGTGFYNVWTYLKSEAPCGAFNNFGKDEVLHMPLAHAEGRFVMSTQSLATLKEQGCITFQYCTAAGKLDAEFPINPNGSLENIAALSNFAGNVLAIMPHPERTSNGDLIFASMKQYIEKTAFVPPKSIIYDDEVVEIKTRAKLNQETEYFIATVITDNQAVSVEQALRQQGLAVKVRRYRYWRLQADPALRNAIVASGELFNENKEYVTVLKNKFNIKRYLVEAREDCDAHRLQQVLKVHLGRNDFNLKSGIVWELEAESGDIGSLATQVIATNLLMNPSAYECTDYTECLE